MNEVISERYKKALVTVAMGFRTEDDIKKNGLYRFSKNEKKNLINYIKQLFNKNKSVLALKVQPTGYHSEYININSVKTLTEFIQNLNNIFGEHNEIWVVSSSVIECWRCRIYLTNNDSNNMIEMSYSYDDHILDHISSDSIVPYVCYKKERSKYILLNNNLEPQKLVEANYIMQDILNKFSKQLKKVREDLFIMGVNSISLDIRVNNGYDFHDFDVPNGDLEKVINYYVPR